MTENEHIEAVASGASVGDLSTGFAVVEAQHVVNRDDGDVYEITADEHTIRQTYAITQLMSASLYSEDAQLDSFQKTLVREHAERAGLAVMSEPRIAYSFGKIEHVGHVENADVQGVDCTPDCGVVGCPEEEASVVLMRIEFDVEAVPSE